MRDAGRLDAKILARAWKRLGRADVVWSSDRYKAELTREFGNLPESPVICHNCPPLDYLPEPSWPRDGWLREELRRQCAAIGDDACILLRAGAVGECGGIEAALQAMRRLPAKHVFLMMGQPSREYRQKILRMISEMGLRCRAFLWEKPSDEIWKRALLGADVGHLVHGPFPQGHMTRMYELNSSLSNNRLFQYMAAGLPILSYNDPRMSDIHSEVDCFRVLRTSHLVEDTYQAMLALASDVSVRMRMGKVGHKAHKVSYNWEKQFAPVLGALDGRQRTLQLTHANSR
jgi:glycosyltransferase involved in cell wall biosynthesis